MVHPAVWMGLCSPAQIDKTKGFEYFDGASNAIRLKEKKLIVPVGVHSDKKSEGAYAKKKN